jgi:hypothetical protein
LPHLGSDSLVRESGFLPQRSADESGEKRVRAVGSRFELWMELSGDEERVVGQFNGFNQFAIGRNPTKHHPVSLQNFVIARVDFVSVSVALVNEVCPVNFGYLRPRLQKAGVSTEPHRSAFLDHSPLLVHQGYDGMASSLVKLGAVSPVQTANISGELNDSALQPQTQTQKGDAVFTSILDCDDFPFNPAVAETTGDDNPVNAVKKQKLLRNF